MELDGLGVPPAEQQLYEVLLTNPNPTLAELAGHTGLPARRLRTLLNSLAGKGLLSRTEDRPTRFTAAPRTSPSRCWPCAASRRSSRPGWPPWPSARGSGRGSGPG